MKNLTLNVLSLVILGCLVQSCGKSDATKDFNDLKLVSPHSDSAQNQKILDSVMNITVQSADGSTPIFLEGETNEIKLNLNILDKDISSAEIAFDKSSQPSGSTLKKSPTEPNVYIFNWTPPVGFIGSGLSKTVPMAFVAHVLTGPSMFLNFVNTLNISIIVEQTQVTPHIVSINVPQTSEEGVDQIVTVKVEDKAHSAFNQPNVNIISYKGERNDENHKFDWASKVTPNQPFVSGPDASGVYTYSYTLNLKGQTLPVPPLESNAKKNDPNASVVNLCFSVSATSNVSQLSSSLDQCARVEFTAQPPVVYFDGDPDGTILANDMIAGQENTLSFEVKTPNSQGNIKTPITTFSSFLTSDANGKPKVTEIANPKTGAAIASSSADRFYTLTWTPSCKATGSYNFRMQLTTDLNGKTKTAPTVSRKINISSKASSCDVVTPPVKTVEKPAAKPPVKQPTQPATQLTTKPSAEPKTK